jgi:hypothetical protein
MNCRRELPPSIHVAEKLGISGDNGEKDHSGAEAPFISLGLLARLKSCPDKKQKWKFNKARERRKGPCLKARVENFVTQWPEGHCSLRRNQDDVGPFHPLRVGSGGGGLTQNLPQSNSSAAWVGRAV